ncbi:hypothetical protein GCHA_4483 [Paraglaciecola chathamensis S18K6]|uniref:Uncharacterized protein n=1 Tax=Paraglaciecola chathamensis S18K6 TaxID=1127672 RepID=A0AAV3V6J3_9ALTE|nr:hypothetical protein GCHA_4483 [Paraglaciecola chathamensis S18K6]
MSSPKECIGYTHVLFGISVTGLIIPANVFSCPNRIALFIRSSMYSN